MDLAARQTRAALARDLALIARRAGAEIEAVRAAGFDVEAKDDASPVTEADRRAEAAILEGLADAAPGVGAIAEESVDYDDGSAVASGRYFLVDPLDGTREFVAGRGEFTVNIALVEAGVPSMGVILAPAADRLFLAWAPGKAFEEDAGGARRPVRTRARPAAPVAVASRSHRDAATDAYLAKLGVAETRSSGSSLKFCLVAAGEADIYPRFGPTSEWDTAAGHALLLAAGGNMTRLDGAPFTYGKRAERYLNPGFLVWGSGPRPPLPDVG